MRTENLMNLYTPFFSFSFLVGVRGGQRIEVVILENPMGEWGVVVEHRIFIFSFNINLYG